ncbi:brachyurin-like [Asbolus verrucosus]|uniref:Brachyurin-like n=1 Tax=Asbolus verrucosus TaxID=1661398 RepID=A0A482VS70_ASBVE|nr:brachyurin-like [Asbolus verrucosus]
MKFLVFVVVAIALAEANRVRPGIHKPRLRPDIFRSLKLPKFEKKSTPSVRITGGEEVTPHSLPYQVGLLIPTSDGTAFCGGSLISPTTVLTAAHCGELSNTIEVRLGAHRVRDDEPTQIRVNSSQVIVHPDWDRLTLQNDLAIIRLPEAVELNENINVVRLPTDTSNDYLNDVATASGWGKDSDDATSISDALRSIQVPVGENGVCNLYYLGVIQESHICASGDGGKSTCSGDSGGPLVASTGELVKEITSGDFSSLIVLVPDRCHLIRHLFRMRNRMAIRLQSRDLFLGLDRAKF